MDLSTLHINQRILDAAAALQQASIPRLEANDLEAAAEALDTEELVDALQSGEGAMSAWAASAEAFRVGVAGVMAEVHGASVEAAADFLGAVPADLDAQGDALAGAAGTVVAETDEASAHQAALAQRAGEAHGAFAGNVKELKASYEERYAALRDTFAAFTTALTDRVKPELGRNADEWLSGLQTFGTLRLGEADDELRETFARAVVDFMDVTEQVATAYRDAARSAASALEKTAADGIEQTLQASVERLKDVAVSMIEREIEQAFEETGLSVAITTAFSSVMPQLIAFYKAVSLLEEAIRIYKEMKSIFGG